MTATIISIIVIIVVLLTARFDSVYPNHPNPLFVEPK